MRRAGRLLAILFGLAFLAIGSIGASRYFTLLTPADAQDANDQKGVLASLISKALSSPGMQVSVGAVDGALTSDATVRDISIADGAGVWLRLDRARIIWTRSALFLGRLEINDLELGKLEILRKPQPSGVLPPSANDQPLLPSLPVRAEISKFVLADLELGEPILGVAAALKAGGEAHLGRPSDGLGLTLDLQRTDAPGAIAVRVAYAPAAQNLTLSLTAHEPAGGLIVRAASIPNQPPIDLDLSGQGRLDAFRAHLTFNAGDVGAFGGDINVDRQQTDRLLTLNLAGPIQGFLPAWIGPVFAGDTTIGGSVRFGDDGSYAANDVQVVAAAARLDINGAVYASGIVDARVAVRAIDQSGRGAHVANIDIAALDIVAQATGRLKAPNLFATIHLADANLPVGRLGRIDGKITTTPNGEVTDLNTRIDVVADVNGDHLALKDAGLARAIGDKFALTLRGRAAPDGDMDVSVAHVTGESVEATATGRFGPDAIDGHVNVSAPDLSRFASLAGVALAGSAKGVINLSGAPSRDDVTADVSLTAERLATGIKTVDALTGGHAEVKGALSKIAGGFALSGLTLEGRHVSARLDGQATTVAADVTLVASAPDLSRVSTDLAGAAQASGHLTGSLNKPDIVASITLSDARALGRPIPHLALAVTAKDILGALDARATLDGIVDGKPASGALGLARVAEGAWRASADRFALGSIKLDGAVTVSPSRMVDGAMDLQAGDLNDLSPLVLQKLAGTLHANLAFDTQTGKQNVVAVASGSSIRSAQATIDRLDLNARIGDLFGAPTIAGTASVDRAVVAGQALTHVRANAAAAGDGSDLSLSADAQGFALSSKGHLAASQPVRLDLTSFEARRDAVRIALAGPAHLSFSPSGVEIRSLALTAGSGRIAVEGAAGQKLDLTVAVRALPLSLAKLASPTLALDGTVDANAKLGGSAAAPTGDWKLDVNRFSAPQTRAAGLPPTDIHATGRLDGQRSTIDAKLALPRSGSIEAQGSVPLSAAGALDIGVRGSIDAALANVALAASGRSVSGRVSIDARARGAIAKPSLSGQATLSGGTFTDPVAGVKLTNIQASLRARGEDIAIDRATASTRNGGTISASGTINIDPAANFPANIRVASNKAELVSNDIVTAVGTLALNLSGPLASRPRVDGKVSLDSMDVRVPDRLPALSRPLADTRHIAPSRQAAERLALARKQAKRANQPAFDADLDITLDAPSRIFVRGRGIDAELGGDLTVTGALSNPTTRGGFNLRRGEFNLGGQRIDFTRGDIKFLGQPIPQIDFIAQTVSADVTARVEVSGVANDPTFVFSSTPDLPQDEVISRLLFSRASGSLSPGQALQLAQVVAEFSGAGGAGVLENLRKSLGVDTLNVGVDANGGPNVGVSRYISKNVTVGVRAGARQEDTAVTLGVDINRNIRVEGAAGADGSSSAGVALQWEY